MFEVKQDILKQIVDRFADVQFLISESQYWTFSDFFEEVILLSNSINARPKKSQYGSEIRHINLVGIHPRHEDGITQTKNEIKENVIKRFDDRGYSVYADRIEVKVIPNTPYYCTIFYIKSYFLQAAYVCVF